MKKIDQDLVERVRFNQMIHRQPAKYGLIGWRKVKKAGTGILGTLGVLTLLVYVLACMALPFAVFYVIAHFILKFW